MASVRGCQKLLPCWTEPVPAGSKVDTPLANAELIGDVGSTLYERTYLIKGKKLWKRGVRKCERNSDAQTLK